MSSSPTAAARLRRELVPFLWLVIAGAVYAILLELFARLTQGRGFVTPSGSLDAGFLAFGILMLAARVTVLFVVPFVAAYQVVRRLVELASQTTSGVTPPPRNAPISP